MKRVVALYGAGKKSLLAEQRLRRHAPWLEASYLIENMDFSKLGQAVPRLDGDQPPLQVISLSRLQQLYASGQCHNVLIPCAYSVFDLREARRFLVQASIDPKDILAMPFNCIMADPDAPLGGQQAVVPFDSMEMIYHLDIHIVDHCNLRCKSCAHFSSLVEGEVVYPADSIAKSLARLASLVPNISSISLLGGEPLLHPELAAIAGHVRAIYPYASINMTTNGLLLRQMPQQTVQALRRNNIHVVVSLYPPMRAEVDLLVQWLRESGLSWHMGRIDCFERRLLPKPIFEAEKGFDKCGHIMCLRGSRIGYCVMALFTDYYNARFGKGQLPEDRGVDVFSVGSGTELLSKLHAPLDLCRQCVSRDAGQHFWEAWEPAGQTPGAEDWFIQSSEHNHAEKQ